MQKTITRRNIEETVLDSHMAVNMIAMLYRLISLLEMNDTDQIEDVVDSIRVKAVVWLISNNLFSGTVNVKQQFETLSLLEIPVLKHSSSIQIAKDLLEHLRRNRTSSLQELITLGVNHVISGITRFLEPFCGYGDEINLNSMWTSIYHNTLKCETCEKQYFQQDTFMQIANPTMDDSNDFSIRVCYNCKSDNDD